MAFDLKDIPPEAEITMASAFMLSSSTITRAHILVDDNSFIETSSGAAAREMKRRFDEYLGVGKAIRSPYAITAFVNQHGKQMYRVGYVSLPALVSDWDTDSSCSARDMSAPAASMEENEVPTVGRTTRSKSLAVAPTPSTSSQPPPPLPTQKVRRSRMSVHSFLPPVIFKNGNTTTSNSPPAPPSKASPAHLQDGTRSPSARKLRKTRSIPNMSSPTPPPQPAPPAITTVDPSVSAGRPHAHSVSSSDAWPPPPRSIAAVDASIAAAPPDTFAEVMFKTPTTGPPSPLETSGGLNSVKSVHSPVEATFEEAARSIIANPFGSNIDFDAPAWQSADLLSSGPPLREMQSFESGLTARADDQPRSLLLGKARARGSDEDLPHTPDESMSDPSTPTANPSFEPAPETLVHSRYTTDLFDVLQNYKGLPIPERINTIPNPTTIRMSLRDQETAVPRDDPRFVIWGSLKSDGHDEHSPARSSVTDASTSHSAAALLSRRKSGKERSGSDAPFVRVEGPTKVLVAATIERWIAQLTSELNYDELLIFFLTYRTYISSLDLGHLLICRFHWALEQTNSSHDEMVRRIVRVRTFIAIRYWLLTFFSVDFVPNRELRLLFANWLNTLRKDPILSRHKDAPVSTVFSRHLM